MTGTSEEHKKPIHFPPEPDWETARAKAKQAFEDLGPVRKRLNCSQHWASQGYWIEFHDSKLSPHDSVMDEVE